MNNKYHKFLNSYISKEPEIAKKALAKEFNLIDIDANNIYQAWRQELIRSSIPSDKAKNVDNNDYNMIQLKLESIRIKGAVEYLADLLNHEISIMIEIGTINSIEAKPLNAIYMNLVDILK